jgi:hypothetical protein
MSLGRDVQRVPADQDRSRLLRLIKAQEKVHDIRRSEVSESHDGAAAFTVLPQNGLGQRMVGAMCEGVPVHDEQGTCVGG